MSFRLITHTPTIGASPGESVIGRVEIFNDGATDAVYTVSVVGLAPDPLHESAAPPPLRVPVLAGTSATADVVVAVPRTLGIGQHAAAFEATSSRSSDRAALTPFTVSIQSVARVELVPQPSTIRARRKARFHLDVTNNEALAVDIALSGEAPDVTVSFSPPAMSLQPGQRAVAKADVRGPRHWSGERTQHNILITARGRASSTSVTAAYVQRPLFAHRFRMVLAGLTVIALWLAAIGGAALWLSNRDDGTDAGAVIVGVDTDGDGIPDAFRDADGNPVTGTDTNGDGIPDEFRDADGNLITGTDTDGDGIPDTLVDAEGRPLKAIDTDGDGKPDTLSNGAPLPDDLPATAPEPQATILRGTVDIDGDPTAVAIALTPVELGAAPSPSATPIGLRAAQPSEPEGKVWSARTTTLNDVVGSPTRRTVAIEPDSTVPGDDGVWLFTDVLQGQSYELSFSSPGYDTQSFVLTPRADGEPIDLDVVMKPANGSLSGTVVGPSGPLGGAEIRITDGTLEFVSTSASGNGTWSLSGVSTPGIYTVTATLRGFATAVRQVRLAPGDTPTSISLQMVPGLGTITGLVTTNGTGLGGVTVTASNGETTLTTTTLTEGNIGFYSLPQLPAPAEYTVQAQLDGYVTNSRRVPLSGSLSGVDFSMTSTTSTLTGRVLSSGGGGIESAGLIVSTGELQFRASTSPTGAFEIDRLPPGDYTITVEHFQHESITEFTTLTAGSTPTPLTITLPLSTGPPDVGTGSLVVSVINEDSTIVPAGINNARVTISRNRSADVRVLQDPDASAVTFEDLPIGTWTINVTAAGYNVSAPVTRSVGLARERAEIRLQRLGSASGTMINSLDGTPLTGYTVNLFRLQNDTDTVGTPAGSFTANAAGAWTTPADALPTGVYRIQATSPLGFFVRNDQILDTSPEVKNRTMSFLVPVLTDAEVKPLVIAPIEADPYPTITGKIYKPRLNGAVVEYDAVDEPSLAVTGVCNGDPVPAGDISITDAFGPTGGAPDLFDTFSITKEAVAELDPDRRTSGNVLVHRRGRQPRRRHDLAVQHPAEQRARFERPARGSGAGQDAGAADRHRVLVRQGPRPRRPRPTGQRRDRCRGAGDHRVRIDRTLRRPAGPPSGAGARAVHCDEHTDDLVDTGRLDPDGAGVRHLELRVHDTELHPRLGAGDDQRNRTGRAADGNERQRAHRAGRRHGFRHRAHASESRHGQRPGDDPDLRHAEVRHEHGERHRSVRRDPRDDAQPIDGQFQLRRRDRRHVERDVRRPAKPRPRACGNDACAVRRPPRTRRLHHRCRRHLHRTRQRASQALRQDDRRPDHPECRPRSDPTGIADPHRSGEQPSEQRSRARRRLRADRHPGRRQRAGDDHGRLSPGAATARLRPVEGPDRTGRGSADRRCA